MQRLIFMWMSTARFCRGKRRGALRRGRPICGSSRPPSAATGTSAPALFWQNPSPQRPSALRPASRSAWRCANAAAGAGSAGFPAVFENSKAFIAVCRRYAPVVEQVSIDECFLDMTGTGLLYPDPVAIAHIIKDTIFSELGFTVNVGIAPNKLLAKMASDFESRIRYIRFSRMRSRRSSGRCRSVRCFPSGGPRRKS